MGRPVWMVLASALSVLSLSGASPGQPAEGDRSDPGGRLVESDRGPGVGPRRRPGEGERPLLSGRGGDVLDPEVGREEFAARLRRAADRIDAGDEVALVMREEMPWLLRLAARGGDEFGPGEGGVFRRGPGGAEGRGPEAEGDRRPGRFVGDREWVRDGRGPREFGPDEQAAAGEAIASRFPALAGWIEAGAEAEVGGADGPPERTAERVRWQVLRRASELVALEREDARAAEVGFAELGARAGMLLAVRDYREAVGGGDEGRIEAARQGVRSSLGAMFDARLREKRLELERLNERVERLLAETEKLEESRGEFVEQKLDEFVARLPEGPGRGRAGSGDD